MKTCPLCDAQASKTYSNLKGYMEGLQYDVYECSKCIASFVDPLYCDPQIYNHIYSQVDIVPGYNRYVRYASLVSKVSNPLEVLANSENIYWAVKQSVETHFPKKEGVEILEIGSGLGYLTYSLNKAGYKTTGVDISKEAADQANKRYGNMFKAADIFDLAKVETTRYDAVIMTELIEHVTNPKDFIKAALSLLKPEGKLIITTPNKSFSPKGLPWQSDIPPVHLWWLAEESLSYIAAGFGKKCEFLDFTPYSTKFYELSMDTPMDALQAGLPRLNKDGTVVESRKASNIKSKIFGVVLRYHLAYLRRRLKTKRISKKACTMCAIIS